MSDAPPTTAGAARGAPFQWAVITPEATIDSGECDFLVVPSANGEVGILAGHAALLTRVVPGTVRVHSAGKVRTVNVGAGLVDVRDNHVRVLVATAGPGAVTAPPAV